LLFSSKKSSPMNIKSITYLIGLIIFGFIISKINISQLKFVLENVNLKYFLIAVLLSIPLLICKVWCWQSLLKGQNIQYTMKNCFLMYGSGIFFSFLTPGKLGDFIKVYYIKKDGVPVIESLPSALIDRFLDILTLGLLSYFGLIYFHKLFPQELIVIILLSTLIIIYALLFIFRNHIIKNTLKYILSLILPVKYQQQTHALINNLMNYPKNYLLVALLITLLSWIIYFVQMQFLVASLNIPHISLSFMIFSVSLAGIISIIPISISGLGTRDLVLIYLFGLLLINKESAILFSFSIFLMTVAITILGFICQLIKPLDLKNLTQTISQ